MTELEQPEKRSTLWQEITSRLKNLYTSYRYSLDERVLLWFIVALVYLLTANFSLSGPNPSTRFALIKTFVESGFQNTWFPVEWIEPLWISPDYANIGDKYYCDKAPGLSMFLFPVYLVVKWFFFDLLGNEIGTELLNNVDLLSIDIMQLLLLIINAWGVVRIYDITTRLGVHPKKAITTALIFAFGTIFWAFAPSIFPHSITATILVEATFRLLKIQDNERPFLNALIIGLLLGFGSVIEYPVLFVVPLVCMYLLIPFTKIQPIQFNGIKEERSRWLRTLLKDDTIARRLLLCFVLGIVAIIAFLPLLLYNSYSFGGIDELAYYYSHWYDNIHFYNPLQNGLEVLISSTNRGLLTFSPIVILSVWGLISLYNKYRKESLFILFIAILFIFFYAKNFDPAGGAAFGPRYIVPALPFLIIPLAFLMEEWKSNALFTLMLRILAGLSIFYNFLGLWSGAYGPLIFDPAPHPIFDTCWTRFRDFMGSLLESISKGLLQSDVTFFRSSLWRQNMLNGLLILGLIVLFIMILVVVVMPRLEKASNVKRSTALTGLHKAEINFWYSSFTLAFITAFYFILSPAMSRGYDEATNGIDKPLNITMLPELDLLFFIILVVALGVSSVRLVREILSIPIINIKVQSFLNMRKKM
ncbi:MAG: hypothetical protein ACXAEU_15975 [Candidatus Hodarchaeales archaeon]|jgi:hypothetical protein